MSIHWMNKVWELSQHKGSCLLAMLAIADNANDHGVAWPGYATIAKKTRLSDRTIPRLVEHLAGSNELAVRTGGGGRRDSNLYVILLGRDDEEIKKIAAAIHKKDVNLSSLKGGQFVILDKLSMKSSAKKHDIAVSGEPSRTNGKNNGWMDEDVIGSFLLALPGYNPNNLKLDRAAYNRHAGAYDLEALQYLWRECQSGTNPIGLLLYRLSNGIQSKELTEIKERRIRDDEQRAAYLESINRQPSTPAVVDTMPNDVSLNAPLVGGRITPAQVWLAAQGELQTQLPKPVYNSWINPIVLLGVDGTWKLGVPDERARAWCVNNMLISMKRILTGIVGSACEPEFVVVKRPA